MHHCRSQSGNDSSQIQTKAHNVWKKISYICHFKGSVVKTLRVYICHISIYIKVQLEHVRRLAFLADNDFRTLDRNHPHERERRIVVIPGDGTLVTMITTLSGSYPTLSRLAS